MDLNLNYKFPTSGTDYTNNINFTPVFHQSLDSPTKITKNIAWGLEIAKCNFKLKEQTGMMFYCFYISEEALELRTFVFYVINLGILKDQL